MGHQRMGSYDEWGASDSSVGVWELKGEADSSHLIKRHQLATVGDGLCLLHGVHVLGGLW